MKRISKEAALLVAITSIACKHHIDITNGENNNQWYNISNALANTFGDDSEYGRTQFHLLSQFREDSFADTDAVYNKSLESNNSASFASIIFYAARAGIIRANYLLTYKDDYEILSI